MSLRGQGASTSFCHTFRSTSQHNLCVTGAPWGSGACAYLLAWGKQHLCQSNSLLGRQRSMPKPALQSLQQHGPSTAGCSWQHSCCVRDGEGAGAGNLGKVSSSSRHHQEGCPPAKSDMCKCALCCLVDSATLLLQPVRSCVGPAAFHSVYALLPVLAVTQSPCRLHRVLNLRNREVLFWIQSPIESLNPRAEHQSSPAAAVADDIESHNTNITR